METPDKIDLPPFDNDQSENNSDIGIPHSAEKTTKLKQSEMETTDKTVLPPSDKDQSENNSYTETAMNESELREALEKANERIKRYAEKDYSSMMRIANLETEIEYLKEIIKLKGNDVRIFRYQLDKVKYENELMLKQQQQRYDKQLNVKNVRISQFEKDRQIFHLEKKELLQSKEELLTRLSKLASSKLTQNNPGITDLSDSNRESKIADQFIELYDTEWTDAYEELSDSGLNENEVIYVILDIVKTAFTICSDIAEKYKSGIFESPSHLPILDVIQQSVPNIKVNPEIELPDEIRFQLEDIRKTLSPLFCTSIKEMFVNILGDRLPRSMTTAKSRILDNNSEVALSKTLFSTNEDKEDVISGQYDKVEASSKQRSEAVDGYSGKISRKQSNETSLQQDNGEPHGEEGIVEADEQQDSVESLGQQGVVETDNQRDNVGNDVKCDNGEADGKQNNNIDVHRHENNKYADRHQFNIEEDGQQVNEEAGGKKENMTTDGTQDNTDTKRDKNHVKADEEQKSNIEGHIKQGNKELNGQQVKDKRDGIKGCCVGKGLQVNTAADKTQENFGVKKQKNNVETDERQQQEKDEKYNIQEEHESQECIEAVWKQDNQETDIQKEEEQLSNIETTKGIHSFIEGENNANHGSFINDKYHPESEKRKFLVNKTEGINQLNKEEADGQSVNDNEILLDTSLINKDDQIIKALTNSHEMNHRDDKAEPSPSNESGTEYTTVLSKEDKLRLCSQLQNESFDQNANNNETRNIEIKKTNEEDNFDARSYSSVSVFASNERQNLEEKDEKYNTQELHELQESIETVEKQNHKKTDSQKRGEHVFKIETTKEIQSDNANHGSFINGKNHPEREIRKPVADKTQEIVRNDDIDTTKSLVENLQRENGKRTNHTTDPLQHNKNIDRVELDYDDGIYKPTNEEIKFDMKLYRYVRIFASKCARLCWLMRIKDPPLQLMWNCTRGSEFNENLFKRYTRSGKKVDFVVWPALFLHENGPLLAKGIAQPLQKNES